MPGQWAGSNRALPLHWESLRRTILKRDNHRCTWLEGIDQLRDGAPGLTAYLAREYHDAQRCDAHGTDVDHALTPHDHRPEALRTLCSWHHDRRTSSQGNAARRRPTNRRQAEPHPGLLTAATEPPF